MYAGGMMQPAHEAIDLMPYAAAVNGALAHHRPAFVATSGEDGTPDIGPQGSLFVADAGHLAYLEYLRRNARVAVVCFDPEAEPRYVRFYGEANCSRQELCEMNSELGFTRSSWPTTPTTPGSSCASASTKW